MSAAKPLSQAVSMHSPWRSPGLWMSAFLIVYMLFNTIRALLNPVDFALSYGTPLGDGDSTSFVIVYAIRALFLGLFGLGLLLRRNYGGLALYALIGAVMPIGDALLVAAEGGAVGTIVRHLFTAVFLVFTAYLVHRWAVLQRENN